MEIRFIASSSAGNAYVVDDGSTRLLIECGIRYQQLQEALGFRVAELGGCLISHEHGDHSRAVFELMRAGVDVYASAGTFAELGASGHRARAVAAKKPFRVGTWQVVAFPAVHDAAEPLGFLLVSGAEKLLYLTDSAYCEPRFAGLTVIAIEANYSEAKLRERRNAGEIPPAHRNRILRNHLSLERLLVLLEANDLSQVRGIHLLHLSSGNSDAEEFKRAVEAATGKPTFVAPERMEAGETKTLTEWADVVGINRYTIHARLKRGWSIERALTEPVASARAAAGRTR